MGWTYLCYFFFPRSEGSYSCTNVSVLRYLVLICLKKPQFWLDCHITRFGSILHRYCFTNFLVSLGSWLLRSVAAFTEVLLPLQWSSRSVLSYPYLWHSNMWAMELSSLHVLQKRLSIRNLPLPTCSISSFLFIGILRFSLTCGFLLGFWKRG